MASGFAGVEIAASVNGTYLGDARFAPFWAAAEATGALVFVHPTTRGFNDAVFEDFYLSNLVGNPMETTIAAAHVVLAGVLERHPRLRVLLAHGGGAIAALRGRLRHGWSFQPQARSCLRESPVDSLRRFYFDSVTHDPVVLATSSRSPAPSACCSAPTTRSTWQTRARPTPSPPRSSTPRPSARSSAATQRGFLDWRFPVDDRRRRRGRARATTASSPRRTLRPPATRSSSSTRARSRAVARRPRSCSAPATGSTRARPATRSSRRTRCCSTTSSACKPTTASSTSCPTRSRTSRSRTAASSRCGWTSSARARRSRGSRARTPRRTGGCSPTTTRSRASSARRRSRRPASARRSSSASPSTLAAGSGSASG